MSVNKHLSHIFVLPEDDANSDLANGFHQEVAQNRYRQMQALPVAGGWLKVLECFKNDHIRDMQRFPQRFLVLLIDFDHQLERLNQAEKVVPNELKDRVFVLGVLSEPEDLSRNERRSLEIMGMALAQDCRNDTYILWNHNLLKHNSSELERLRQKVRQILF
ncbi:MAG: hypothetical protein AB1757_21440 [Acidobacteriota bacterium]